MSHRLAITNFRILRSVKPNVPVRSDVASFRARVIKALAASFSAFGLDDSGFGIRGFAIFRDLALGNLSIRRAIRGLKAERKGKKRTGREKMAARSGGRFARVSADCVRADQASPARRIVFFIIPDGLRAMTGYRTETAGRAGTNK